MSSSSFIDRNDYISRLANLPVPGANSRTNNKLDPFAVTKQWQTSLIASEYLLHGTNNSSSSSTSNKNNNNINDATKLKITQQAELHSSHRRIVQLKLSLLPTAPSTMLDISLPPALTGGDVDLFWPSDTSSVVDEMSFELPQVPPIVINNKNNTSSPEKVDHLIQQQWIPRIQNSLKSNIMKLHRFIALRPGGIKNKRWEFEAESYLSSLAEDEWDVQVEKSSISSSTNTNNNNHHDTSTTRGIMNAIEGYVFGNSNSTSSSSLQNTHQNTMAIHLRMKLFSKARSSENRERLLKAISRIMKHATEQLKGGEVRDQLEVLDSVRGNSGFIQKERSRSPSPSSSSSSLHRQSSNIISSEKQDQQQQEQQQNSSSSSSALSPTSFDVTSHLSFVIHVSENVSNEYQFAAIQNQQIVFDILDLVDEESNNNNNSNNDTHHLRKVAFKMLKTRLFEELFPASVSKSPLPRANKEEFSFYDFVPSVEETILASVERMSNWCKVLYGFSITFGSPFWNRASLSSLLSDQYYHHQAPPCFSNTATFMFETPRTDLSSPVISLFIQLTLANNNANNNSQQEQQQHGRSPSSGDHQHANHINRTSSKIAPSVNILSTQLERNGQPVMFAWNPATSSSSQQNTPRNSNQNQNQNQNQDEYDSMAGSVLQFLVDSIPKLQGLYRSLLQQTQTSSSTPLTTPPASQGQFMRTASSGNNNNNNNNASSRKSSVPTSPQQQPLQGQTPQQPQIHQGTVLK